MSAHFDLTGLAIVVLAASLLGYAMTRLKQSPIVGYILAGVILGPSVLGLVEDRAGIELLAELGERPASVSDAARGLGFAGLLPFTGGALAIAFVRTDLVSAWLAYAVLILAFMAGTQWGAALAWRDAPWSFWLRSVAAPLVAWPLLQTEAVLQAWGLTLLFGALLALDRRLEDAGRYPAGYFRLRLQLTAVVMLSLAFGAVAMDW